MRAVKSTYKGSCHCGAIGYLFTTDIPPHEWVVRACQCSFCRAHGGCSTADPNGSVRFTISDPSRLNRYRFALKITDFFVCNACGVYVGAVMPLPDRFLAVVNLRTLVSPVEFPPASPASYEGESASERQARREQWWTPVEGAELLNR